jgi:hypothetical protein
MILVTDGPGAWTYVPYTCVLHRATTTFAIGAAERRKKKVKGANLEIGGAKEGRPKSTKFEPKTKTPNPVDGIERISLRPHYTTLVISRKD